MVGERCYWNVVVHVKTERFGVGLRSVGLSVDSEWFGFRTEVSVEDSLETFLPCGWQALVGVFENCVEVSFEHAFHFIVRVLVLAVLQTWIYAFGYSSVAGEHVRYVRSGTALGEIDVAVCADVFVGFVKVAVAYCEHFREVKLFASLVEDFVLKVWCSGEAPACAALVLVFYRSGGINFYVSENKPVDGVGGLLLVCSADVHHCSHSECAC